MIRRFIDLTAEEKSDLVIPLHDRMAYAKDRVLHSDPEVAAEQLKEFRGFKVLNGFKDSEANKSLKKMGSKPFYPAQSEEPHRMVDGILITTNSRDKVREGREEDLWGVICEMLDKKIPMEWRHYENSHILARRRFEKFATDAIDNLFRTVSIDHIASEGLVNLVFSPNRSVPQEILRTAQKIRSEPYTLYHAEVGDVCTIFCGYNYAMQEVTLIRHFAEALDAYCMDTNARVRPVIYHAGKIGGLDAAHEVGSIGIPTASFDENCILDKDSIRHANIPNLLRAHNDVYDLFVSLMKGVPITHGTTVNTHSVLQQRKSALLEAARNEGRYVEMEWSQVTGFMNSFHSNFRNLLRPYVIMAGVISDRPIYEQNLGNTTYPLENEIKLMGAYIEIMSKARLLFRDRQYLLR